MALATIETPVSLGTASMDAARVIEEAHRRTVAASPADMALYLQELFGQGLTALILGLDNPKTVGRWARGTAPHPGNLTRVRNVFHIAILLELATSRQTVQSWFMGMNPLLDDRAPALVLTDDPDDAPRVMRAARTFLAYG